MEHQPSDTREKELRELGNVPAPGWLLKTIQARLGQLTPQWAERQYYLGRQICHVNKEPHGEHLRMALGHFQNALHVYTAEAFPSQRVKVLCASGRTYRDLGNLCEPDRLTCLERAVMCYKEARQIGLSDRLIARLDQVIRACYQQRIQELKQRADVARTVADFLRLTGQRVSALAHYHQALRLYRLVESRPDEAIVLKDIGDIHTMLQHLDTAMQHYQQALTCFRQMDHHHDVATVLQAMGDVTLARHDKAVAEGYYHEALNLFRQIGDHFHEAAVRASLGLQVEEADLYQKVGETNISHMQFSLFDRHVALLDRPVPHETASGVRIGSSPASRDPAREGPVLSTDTSPRAPGVRRWRKRTRWILLTLMFLLIVAPVAAWGTGLLFSPRSCTLTARQIPSSGIGVQRTHTGECVGLSDGTAVFDIDQSGRSDSILKQQAAEALAKGNKAEALALFQQAVQQDRSDAEARIYLEDLDVLNSGQPFITFIVGTKISGNLIGPTGDRRILQGASIAQMEYNHTCRDQCPLIRLLIANTGNDAENAENVAQQIVQAARADSTILGVEGWSASQDTFNIVSALQLAHLPMVSGTASSDLLTGISPYFFRVAPPDSTQGALAADYVAKTLHARHIALFVDPANAYSSSLAGVFKQHLSTDISVVIQSYTVGSYAKDNNRLHDNLQNIAKNHPDLIYFAGYSSDGRALLEELSREKQPAHLLVVGGDALYNLVGNPDQHTPGLERLRFTAFASPNEWQFLHLSGEEPPFFQEYARIFASPAPNGNVILTYDALQVLLQAYQRASVTRKAHVTGQDIQQALQNITGLQGISGQITLGKDGDPQDKAVVMLGVDQQGRTHILDMSGMFLHR
jgi:ABC-type branched-subunit amino acid transport system substrate-binding protein